MLVHRRFTTSIEFAGTHLYTWVERGTVRVKCLAQEHNAVTPARARTRAARPGDERTNHEATAAPLKQYYPEKTSPRSKRFRGFGSKELPREKRGVRGRGKKEVSFFPLPQPLFLILALAPFSRGQNPVPWSFFAPQPHRNACYAGYEKTFATYSWFWPQTVNLS